MSLWKDDITDAEVKGAIEWLDKMEKKYGSNWTDDLKDTDFVSSLHGYRRVKPVKKSKRISKPKYVCPEKMF